MLWHFAITRNMRTLNNGPRKKVLTLQYVTTFAVTSCSFREGNKGCQMFQWLAIHPSLVWQVCRGSLVILLHFCMDVLVFRCMRAQWRCCFSDYWRVRSGAPERGAHTQMQRSSTLHCCAVRQWKTRSLTARFQSVNSLISLKAGGFEMPLENRKRSNYVLLVQFFSFSCSF